MNDKCDFAMEHADGSFMDHLQFCYEYGCAHYKQQSPRVLLLHSVLGVGTNYFPCTTAQIPELKALLTDDEFAHVEAFPSLLRLIVHGRLLPALAAAGDAKGLAFHRVIDNAPLELDAEQLWVALNFQLVHLLDFLPVVDWEKELARDLFLFNFAALYKLLEQRGRLDARVDLSLARPRASPYAPDPKRLSLGDLIRDYVPAAIQAALGKKEIAKYSGAIGHSLDFTIRT